MDSKANDVQSVIIKLSLALTKGFNTQAPLNENFSEDFSKKLGTLEISKSIRGNCPHLLVIKNLTADYLYS